MLSSRVPIYLPLPAELMLRCGAPELAPSPASPILPETRLVELLAMAPWSAAPGDWDMEQETQPGLAKPV
jgi:hypothetical protein